ncbi:hypothetical protein JVU11DRAFT_11573 [Chiua virens]|nr:hypothetical protein JVU11DRAFT_11573 [Chiua virens]
MSLLTRFRLEHAHTGGSSNDAEGSAPASAGETTGAHLDDFDRLSFPPSSPAGERSSTMEPPPPGQRRRERSDSAEEALERGSQRRHKRRCAVQVCRDLELAEDALTAFADLDLPGMLITIFGKLLWLERERMKDEVHSFIKSDEFKDVLQDLLRTALLSANISRYLNGINDRIWGFIKKNLAVFNIPPLVMEDA